MIQTHETGKKESEITGSVKGFLGSCAFMFLSLWCLGLLRDAGAGAGSLRYALEFVVWISVVIAGVLILGNVIRFVRAV